MTGRDRMVVIGVVIVAALAAAWMLVVSPEREKANKVSAKVVHAQAQLASAEGEVANARTAQAQYTAAYASVVSLGKAVPAAQEVPSLIYQLTEASNEKRVDFTSIATGASGSSSGSASASAASGGFSQLPFTFVFEGGFFGLEHLFRQLTDFTTLTASGDVQVSGRLLTIQSVKLSPVTGSAAPVNGAASFLTGSITATAYSLPASQGLTGSASPSAPTGTGATPASTTAPASSPTAPAIVRVNP